MEPGLGFGPGGPRASSANKRILTIRVQVEVSTKIIITVPFSEALNTQ